VELRAHTAFSFGDGVLTPERLVARAAEQGYPALGVTDSADVGGVIRFTLEAERQGIKPIGGVELQVDGHPLALLARNAEGYRNIAALITKSRLGDVARWSDVGEVRRRRENDRGVNLERKYAVPLPPRGRPALTFLDLAEHAAGVWCLTGPASGEIATLLGCELAGHLGVGAADAIGFEPTGVSANRNRKHSVLHQSHGSNQRYSDPESPGHVLQLSGPRAVS
jgi:hypothetical protein